MFGDLLASALKTKFFDREISFGQSFSMPIYAMIIILLGIAALIALFVILAVKADKKGRRTKRIETGPIDVSGDTPVSEARDEDEVLRNNGEVTSAYTRVYGGTIEKKPEETEELNPVERVETPEEEKEDEFANAEIIPDEELEEVVIAEEPEETEPEEEEPEEAEEEIEETEEIEEKPEEVEELEEIAEEVEELEEIEEEPVEAEEVEELEEIEEEPVEAEEVVEIEEIEEVEPEEVKPEEKPEETTEEPVEEVEEIKEEPAAEEIVAAEDEIQKEKEKTEMKKAEKPEKKTEKKPAAKPAAKPAPKAAAKPASKASTKAEKPAPKAPAKPTPAAKTDNKVVGKIEICNSELGGFNYLLRANNGQLLYESKAYKSMDSCKEAIANFIEAVKVGMFSVREDKFKNYKFILKSPTSSSLVYQGESFATESSCKSNIESVKRFAVNSVIVDITEKDFVAKYDRYEIPESVIKQVKSDNLATGKWVIERTDVKSKTAPFEFLLYANNGQLLYESNDYKTAASCMSGLKTFANTVKNGYFVIDPEKSGKFKFVLRSNAASSVTVYYGNSYDTKKAAANNVNSVYRFALITPIPER